MTTELSPAAVLVNDMIQRAKDEIQFANQQLAQALATLARRTTETQAKLDGELGIADTGIDAAAAKVEQAVAHRTAAYLNLRSLEHVRKAC